MTWWERDTELLVPAIRADIDVRRMGDELVCTHADGRILHLNGTAAFVWERCDGVTTTRAIARELTEAYEVDLEHALDDVEQLVLLFAEQAFFAEGSPA